MGSNLEHNNLHVEIVPTNAAFDFSRDRANISCDKGLEFLSSDCGASGSAELNWSDLLLFLS